MSRLIQGSLSLALIALFASAGYAKPPAAVLKGAKSASVVGNAGQNVLVIEEGFGETPELTGESTLVFVGSDLLRVPNETLRGVISKGFFRVAGRVVLAIEFGESDLQQSSNLVLKAAAKLTPAESNAFLSTAAAIAAAELDDAVSNIPPTTADIMASFRAIMAEIGKPLRFQAADGTEFDYYGDYLAYQWGWDSCD